MGRPSIGSRDRVRSLTLPWLLLSLLAGLWQPTSAGLAQHAEDAPFSQAERRALRSGQLVRRHRTVQRDGVEYTGGTSFIRVRAPATEVFAAITEVRNYPRLLPGLERARLVQGSPDDRVVFLRHRYSFIAASYYARVRIDREAREVSFELDHSRPHAIREGRGYIRVQSFRGDESIVTWGVMADPGIGIVSGVFSPIIDEWILKVPWCVRGFVEDDQPGC